MSAPMNTPIPPDAVAVAMLPVGAILASPSNPRKHFDEAYIAELADSIKSHGLIQPITVRPLPLDDLMAFNRSNPGRDPADTPSYQIVVGECRWRAAKRAGLAEIPGFWRELDDRQVLEIQVIENLQRRDVHPIEEAEGYQQLMQHHGYTADTLAAKIGKSKGYVYARLKLTALGAAAREAFFAGKLEASTALLIARIPGEALQKKAVKDVTESYGGEPLSYRSAKNHIRHNFTISLKQATFPLDDADLVPAVGSCAACPKRSGNAPEICADLEDADVCTDTACFEDKRLARRTQLIASAEKRKIPVLTDHEARETYYAEDRTDLDEEAAGDGQCRTWREILGDKAPKPVALVEIGHGNFQRLAEMVDSTALEKALQKAGWTSDMFKETADDTKPSRAEEQRQREEEFQAAKAKREATRAAAEQEQARRVGLAGNLFGRLQRMGDDGEINTDPLLGLLCAAWLRFDFSFNGEVDAPRLERFGITVPVEPLAEGQDDYDDGEELEKVAALVQAWPPGKALAFLFDVTTSEETNVVNTFNFDPEKDRAHTLEALEKLLDPAGGILSTPASPPTNAAQAQDEAPAAANGKKPAAKKAKGKTDPAPAMPANEAAAPPKSVHERVMAHTDWPFPQVRA